MDILLRQHSSRFIGYGGDGARGVVGKEVGVGRRRSIGNPAGWGIVNLFRNIFRNDRTAGISREAIWVYWRMRDCDSARSKRIGVGEGKKRIPLGSCVTLAVQRSPGLDRIDSRTSRGYRLGRRSVGILW